MVKNTLLRGKSFIPNKNDDHVEIEPLIDMMEVAEEEEKVSDEKTDSSDADKDVIKTQITDFTDLVGGSGAWQISVLVITLISGIPVAWNHMAISFFASPQDYWCARPHGINVSLDFWLKNAMPNRTFEGVTNHSQCEIYDIYKNFSNHNEIPCTEWEFYPDYLTITKEWNLVCSREWMSSMSQSIYMGGFLIAVFLFGQISDLYGRHLTIMVTVVLLLVSGLLTAYASTYMMFIIARFFVGMGQSGLSLITFVLLIEIVGADYRATYGVVQGCGWFIGYCLLPLMAWYLPSWHHLQLAITLPCIIYLTFYWILPESPRWLLANGELDRAVQVLTTASKWNKKKVTDLSSQVKKLTRMAEKADDTSGKVTVFDLLRTPNLRKKTLVLFFIWIVTSFVYYSLSLTTGQLGGDYYINFLLSGLVELPASLFCLIALQRIGRKAPFVFTNLGAGVACLIVVCIPKTNHWCLVAFAMIGKLFVSSSFSIIYIYSAEIFPTVARNVGLGVSSTVARIGSIVAPFMKDLGKITSPSTPMALCGILSLIAGLFVLLLPETKGYPVPETLRQAENFGNKDDKQDLELKQFRQKKSSTS